MTGDTQNVVPALERALLEGGVGIRDSRSNTILYKDQIKGTMGFCLNDWEVICLGRTTVSDMRMTMGDLAKVIGFPDIGLDSAKALDLLYDGINMSLTNTADTALRFRASFIDALSSNGFPFTGLSGIVNGNAPVSQLQASMMILQYASDLAGFLKSHPAGAPKKLVTGSRSGTTTDCNFDEASSTVMDWSAFGITYGYGKLLGYLEDAGMSAAGKYAQVSGAVSAALALIKFIASGAALETTLDVEGGEPLMRTTTRQPGERKVLKATAKFNIGSWSYLNCARIAFNAANTDFNLPNDGPLDGVKVAWSLNIGSTDFGTNVIQNSIVQFYSLDGGAITQMKTDKDGKTSIGLEGAPQDHDLDPPLIPDMKTARVEVRFAINTQKLFSDILSGLGAVTSGPWAALTIPLETLSRIPLQGRARNIQVKDWLEYQ